MKNVLIGLVLLVGVVSFSFQALADPEPPQLEIISIGTDFEENTLIIVGENFDNGSPPVVTFGGVELEVDSYSAINIVAYLPDPDVQLDDQVLTVTTGEDPQQFASLDLDTASVADEDYAIFFRRNVLRAPQDPTCRNSTSTGCQETAQFAWKDGPIRVNDGKNVFGDPVYYQTLKDYTIDISRYLNHYDWAAELTDFRGGKGGLYTFGCRLPNIKNHWNDHDLQNVMWDYIDLSNGYLTIRKGFRWDGPSLEVPLIGTRISAKPAAQIRGSMVHDSLYDLMRLGLITRDHFIPLTTIGFRNRLMADCLMYMLFRQDGTAKNSLLLLDSGSALYNFNFVRFGGAPKTGDDLPNWKYHATAFPGEDQTHSCASPAEGIAVLLDGSDSRFAQFWEWTVNGLVISSGASPSVERIFPPAYIPQRSPLTMVMTRLKAPSRIVTR